MRGGLISLTFDDGLDQHLDHVVPALDAHRLCGTFYAHLTAPSLCRRLPEWRSVAASGHELGNHTVVHPAEARKSWVTAGNAIEDYCLDRMRMELQVANDWLRTIDGELQRTFAYPCSNPVIGRFGTPVRVLRSCGLQHTRWPRMVERWGMDWGSTRKNYQELLPGVVFAARGGGLCFDQLPPPLERLDRFQLPSAACNRDDLEVMRTFIDRCIAADRWAILQFHGVGGGHWMDCDLMVFRELIGWIGAQHAARVVTVLAGAEQMVRHER